MVYKRTGYQKNFSEFGGGKRVEPGRKQKRKILELEETNYIHF